jgi:hypothetical protein
VSDQKTKRTKLLEALLAGDRLSKQDILKRFHLWNGGGAIYVFRQEGWNIQTEMVERHGEKFAEYFMEAK